MDRAWSPSLALPSAWRADHAAYGAIGGFGALLYWLSAAHPSLMPVWAPFDFSWTEYLATALGLLWYFRGLARSPPEARPSLWRRVTFVAGAGVIYAVLQTRFEYIAQHMFFLNRAQHVAMHHVGPFLIALAWPGATLWRGMPAWARRVAARPAVAAVIRVLQQPLFAALLFVGLFYFWLIPPVHVRAMLDPRLYFVMNWSMVLDGLLFWSLVLDPRPSPPARAPFPVRAALAFGVMIPQILLGVVITFAPRDLYPYYDLCGRLIPSIGALADQRIGAIVSWIPPVMMSVAAVLLVLNAYMASEETKAHAPSVAALPRS